MKKRLLLILVVGLSFAPPVFGAQETLRDTPSQSIRCGSEYSKKVLPEDRVASQDRQKSGTSASAESPRIE